MSKDGRSTCCKKCCVAYSKKYYKKNKSKIKKRVKTHSRKNKRKIYKQRKSYRRKNDKEIKEKKRELYYLSKYGITLNQKKEMLDDCGWGCEVCGKKVDVRTGKVDHDHKTGKIRGILCNSCNNRIIAVIESDLYQKGLDYLKKYGQITEPKKRRRNNV